MNIFKEFARQFVEIVATEFAKVITSEGSVIQWEYTSEGLLEGTGVGKEAVLAAQILSGVQFPIEMLGTMDSLSVETSLYTLTVVGLWDGGSAPLVKLTYKS